jgi:hypothetical protein
MKRSPFEHLLLFLFLYDAWAFEQTGAKVIGRDAYLPFLFSVGLTDNA